MTNRRRSVLLFVIDFCIRGLAFCLGLLVFLHFREDAGFLGFLTPRVVVLIEGFSGWTLYETIDTLRRVFIMPALRGDDEPKAAA